MFGLLVAVTDLAFGWSTTLQLDAARVHGWVAGLASPWSHIWPAAAPDVSLVEASRYFRLQGELGEITAARLGEWWPFVSMSLLVWGLLPRMLMLFWCRWRVERATHLLLREHSEVTALLDRMGTPRLALGEEVATTAADVVATAEIVALPDVTDAFTIEFNDALGQGAGVQIGLQLSSLLSESELRAAVETIPAETQRLMLEVLDVLQLLRRRVKADSSIIVTPLGLPEGSFQTDDAQLRIWSAAVANLQDPHTYVAHADRALTDPGQQHG
jgi:hypothetical protein